MTIGYLVRQCRSATITIYGSRAKAKVQYASIHFKALFTIFNMLSALHISKTNKAISFCVLTGKSITKLTEWLVFLKYYTQPLKEISAEPERLG